MNLEQRIDLLVELGEYCVSEAPAWSAAKRRAHAENGWFTPEFIELAVRQIAAEYLKKDRLLAWAKQYRLSDAPTPSLAGAPRNAPPAPRTIGLIMAGNIPLVGFHDFLAIFLSGHHQLIKPSTRDQVLIRHLAEQLVAICPAAAERFGFAERLNGCDAYIATGSNNSARYFEYYFSKYPHIIRRNRTSVALLSGRETGQELEALADDVYQYFGLGCRNVTQLYTPEGYDFLPLLAAFRKYDYLADLARYKHNYDFQLTLLILNKRKYMSGESILLTEDNSPFSPISVLHYVYYQPGVPVAALTGEHPDIQCVVGNAQYFPNQNQANQPSPNQNFGLNTVERFDKASSLALPRSYPSFHSGTFGTFASSVPFGQAQRPGLTDYADGVDTLQFLCSL
jgi:hypothetical protein